jgi:hypothetical protein
VIYLDTSVALAQLFAEDRRPPDELWGSPLVSSRLLEFELWNRVNARRLAKLHGEKVRDLLGRVAFVEMVRPVLERALEPFPTPVRTLDALHLASVDFLRRLGQPVQLASYDERMLVAARKLRIAVLDLSA